MKRKIYICTVVCGLLLVVATRVAQLQSKSNADPQFAVGIVFHDKNGNKKYEKGEPVLPNVRVSNGRDIVKTDQHGRYKLAVNDDTIVFIVKPRGWRTVLSDTRLPRFYYIHKPNGSPKLKYPGVKPTGPLPSSVDFPLYPQREPEQFKAILFGDPQPRNQKEVDYIAHDVVEELVGTDASFGVTLGDVVFDRLDLFESQARTIALLGIPWYNVIGNHDINLDASSDQTSDETFERAFGPAYYSFDYGKVHFLVIDNIEWYVEDAKTKDGKKKRGYRGGLGQRQLEFIRNDLALIPAKQMVVILMHIPLTGVNDRHDLYRMIEKRPFCISVSGHTHHHEHRYITRKDGWRGPQPHHHIINVTVSGSWWKGAPDERKIPHATMADGAPNGYSILSFDGTDYRLDFKAAGRSAEYQMNIHAPELVSQKELAKTTVTVNVFNGSEKSKVSMRIGKNSKWLTMKHSPGIDPLYRQVFEAEKKLKKKPWLSMSGPKTSPHLWKANLPPLPAGTHLIEIRAIDENDRSVSGKRIIRIK